VNLLILYTIPKGRHFDLSNHLIRYFPLNLNLDDSILLNNLLDDLINSHDLSIFDINNHLFFYLHFLYLLNLLNDDLRNLNLDDLEDGNLYDHYLFD